jgi:pimeloyl-ACP methyl ester carboxylesterase
MSVTITRGYVPGKYGQVHYRTAGEDGEHVPVLLLHQNPSSSFEYEPLIRELASDRRVVALDTPGYGMSDAPPEPLSMEGYATAMAESLDAVGLGPSSAFDVYGFHTGALLAIEVALALPDRVRQVAVTGLPMRSAEERAELLAKAKNAPALDEEGEVALAMGRGLWNYVVAARKPGLSLERYGALWMDKYRALDKSSWAYVGVWSYDYDRMRRVTQPALLIQPDETIRDVSIEAIRLVPNHTIIEFPELERDVLDLPEGVSSIAAAMRDFFGRLFLQENAQ